MAVLRVPPDGVGRQPDPKTPVADEPALSAERTRSRQPRTHCARSSTRNSHARARASAHRALRAPGLRGGALRVDAHVAQFVGTDVAGRVHGAEADEVVPVVAVVGRRVDDDARALRPRQAVVAAGLDASLRPTPPAPSSARIAAVDRWLRRGV